MKITVNYQKHFWNNWTVYKQVIKIDKNLMNLYNKELENRKNKINDKIKKYKTFDNSDSDILCYTIDLHNWINYLRHTWLIIFLQVALENWLDTKRIKLDRNTIIQVL